MLAMTSVLRIADRSDAARQMGIKNWPRVTSLIDVVRPEVCP